MDSDFYLCLNLLKTQNFHQILYFTSDMSTSTVILFGVELVRIFPTYFFLLSDVSHGRMPTSRLPTREMRFCSYHTSKIGKYANQDL